MFVRAKRVRSRRYLYLVEGERSGLDVRQKTLSYLGPLSKLIAGVPGPVKERVDGRLRVDWKKVGDEIGRIPLSFEELSEARRAQFSASVKTRTRRGRPAQGALPRTDGELSALSKMSANRFAELFEESGPLAYRMK